MVDAIVRAPWEPTTALDTRTTAGTTDLRDAEITRLRAENERLREALDAIGKVAATAQRHRGNAGKEAFFLAVIEDRARKALEGE